MPLGSITQMYSLDIVAVAVPTGNVIFQENTEKKTHGWCVSSCPRASGALSPALPPPTLLLPLPHLPVSDSDKRGDVL